MAPFAPFPPAAYLSDGARTEGEMKTAFENWLLASKQMEHGQCRLVFASATALKLEPFGGRRVLLNDRPYLVPASGIFATNAGASVSGSMYVYLSDDVGDGSVVTLKHAFIGGGVTRLVDPDSGVSMLSLDGGATPYRQSTIVGIIYTSPTATFTRAGTASLYHPQLNALAVALGADTPTSSTTPVAVITLAGAAFTGQTIAVQANATVDSAGGTFGRISGYSGVTEVLQSSGNLEAGLYTIIPVSWIAGPTTSDGAWSVSLRVSVASGSMTVRGNTHLVVTALA